MRVSRWVCVLTLLTLAACGGGGGDSSVVPDPDASIERRVDNVLLIMLEDAGPQLGAYQTPGAVTPNLDALAARGARYRQAYVSFATCSASKASLLTGYYNHASGATGNVQEFLGSAEALEAANPAWLHDASSAYNVYRIRDEIPTLIERLSAMGMMTGVQNKFHVSPHTKFPYDRWYESSGDSHEQVADFIAAASDAQRPWFLLHVIENSHRPFPDGTATTLPVNVDAVEPPAFLGNDDVIRLDWTEYLSAINKADRRVGDVLRALDESGEADRTLVVLIGDHGPSYHRGKYSTYALGLQVPLIFAGPGIEPDTVREELFSGVDMTPTLMWFLGQVVGSQGVNQGPWLVDARSDVPRELLVGETPKDRSASDGRFQLIFAPDPTATLMPADNRDFDPWRNRAYRRILSKADDPDYAEPYRLLDLADATLSRYQRPRFELYDLDADPWETHDLANDPSYAEDRERLEAALDGWMDRYDDPLERP